jgi:hypothetical protein
MFGSAAIFGYMGRTMSFPPGFNYDATKAAAQRGDPCTGQGCEGWRREAIRRAFLEQKIYVTKTESFRATFMDIFDKYILQNVNSMAVIDSWKSNPMQFWQNQLNFAIWCATTGCV